MDRIGGGIVITDVKSTAGRRKQALTRRMVTDLTAHRTTQDGEREEAGDRWREHGLVWCNRDGMPIDDKADRKDWKEILKLAGVRDARIHDGRHTAATMLLLQGVDPLVVMEIMGWSDRRMLQRYQHVVEELLRDAAKRVGELLHGPEPTPPPADFPATSATPTATPGEFGKLIQFRPRRRTA